jgi:hypothetical protein
LGSVTSEISSQRTQATEILLVGSSSGAIGAMALTSTTETMFPAAKVLLVIDSVPPTPFGFATATHFNKLWGVLPGTHGNAANRSDGAAAVLSSVYSSPLSAHSTMMSSAEGTLAIPCTLSVSCMLTRRFIPAGTPVFVVAPAQDLYSLAFVGSEYIEENLDNNDAVSLNLHTGFWLLRTLPLLGSWCVCVHCRLLSF